MKRTILLLGAGKSSGSLIHYFSRLSGQENWQLTVADLSPELALEKIKGFEHVHAAGLDIHDENNTREKISKADLVISLLPAHLHIAIARQCVDLGVHLATASYVSREMEALHDAAAKRGVILLNECGLDPGLDHMSAMAMIDKLRGEGIEITSFKSYAGGLVAPESNDNPWGYKFSWNPRNVILAGQGTARFIENGTYRYIPYHRLFSSTESISILAEDKDHHQKSQVFDAYANRDSLPYRLIYGLEDIPTFRRGTLRQKNFCKAWNVFVQLGLTDDSYPVGDSSRLTYAEFVRAFLPQGAKGNTLRKQVANFMGLEEEGEIMNMISWTGILSELPIGLEHATPAQILQQLLESRWMLKETDKDMIVMHHELTCRDRDTKNEFRISASLIVKGESPPQTAMAKTVGLPLAVASKLILNNKISGRGCLIPVVREIYEPVLEELKSYGIHFREEHHASSLSL